jgi:hypothetical protein
MPAPFQEVPDIRGDVVLVFDDEDFQGVFHRLHLADAASLAGNVQPN